MTPWLQDADMTIYYGDALAVLRELPDESIHAVACSPPFYGLRDYGVEGQIGLEDTPEQWAARLVEVFRETRRVLRDDGTLWVECGDGYISQGGNRTGHGSNTGQGSRREAEPQGRRRATSGLSGGDAPVSFPGYASAPGLKQKDLIGSPFLLAFALRADGWYWRGCYPWHKPNAMPESVKDRCTTSHSYVLHFSRSPQYFFDGEAIAEPAAWERWGDQTVPKHNGTPTASGWMESKSRDELPVSDSKNARSVWTIPTKGFPEAHFATWPEALAAKIIKCAVPEDGVILDPFGGSGTTALVARKLGRKSILIELNESYCEMAARRLQQLSLLA